LHNIFSFFGTNYHELPRISPKLGGISRNPPSPQAATARQARFGPAFPKITATDCDAVRPAVAGTAMARQACLAERWQKDELFLIFLPLHIAACDSLLNSSFIIQPLFHCSLDEHYIYHIISSTDF